jgi:gluconokinase
MKPRSPPDAPRIVAMGVAGCGKSTVGAAVARREGLPLVEGDDFHSEASRGKMRSGIPLTDEDRAEWLVHLGEQLAAHPEGVVLACSALKRAYRERLRAAAPGLRFVFLEIDRDSARARVASRQPHFFSARLVDSQFATLEPPDGEEGVLTVRATEDLQRLQEQVHAWLEARPRP